MLAEELGLGKRKFHLSKMPLHAKEARPLIRQAGSVSFACVGTGLEDDNRRQAPRIRHEFEECHVLFMGDGVCIGKLMGKLER